MSALTPEHVDDFRDLAKGPWLTVVRSSDLCGDTILRRLVDVVISGIGLVLVSPLLLIIAVAVRVDSAGTSLYSQQRVGRRGVAFSMLKFRSMIADAERLGPLVTGRRDPRITRLGAFLRATKLDELPQLINVLKGDMSIIGPRPEVPRYFPHYSPRELELLTARPGLTGPGQLFLTDREAAALDDADDPEAYYVSRLLHPKLAVDIDYLRDRSFWLDMKILLGTVALVFWRTGSRALDRSSSEPE